MFFDIYLCMFSQNYKDTAKVSNFLVIDWKISN